MTNLFVKKAKTVFTITNDDVAGISLNTNVLTVQEAAAGATSITFCNFKAGCRCACEGYGFCLIAVSPSSFMIRDSNTTNVDIWKRINKQIGAATGATSTTARIVCISEDRKYNVTSEKVSIIVQPLQRPMMGVFDFQGAISTIGEHLLNPVCELQDKDAAYIAYGKQVGYLVAVPCMVGLIIILWRVIGLLPRPPI